jgi:hypothetical protein
MSEGFSALRVIDETEWIFPWSRTGLEVTLVERDAVQFLRLCESRGTELRNCPAYACGQIIKGRSGEDELRPSTNSIRRHGDCRDSVDISTLFAKSTQSFRAEGPA